MRKLVIPDTCQELLYIYAQEIYFFNCSEISDQILSRPHSPWKRYRHLGVWTQVVSNDILGTATPPRQRFILLHLAWRCTRGLLTSPCPKTASPYSCCVGTKWLSVIGAHQHSPPPWASLLAEDNIASAMQMILGLLREMTQERDNMGLQRSSALLPPGSRTSWTVLLSAGVIIAHP